MFNIFGSGISGRLISGTQEDQDEQIRVLKSALDQADAVLIGAGSGLSTAACFTYSG